MRGIALYASQAGPGSGLSRPGVRRREVSSPMTDESSLRDEARQLLAEARALRTSGLASEAAVAHLERRAAAVQRRAQQQH